MPILAHQPQYTMTLVESGSRSLYPSKMQFHSSALFDLFKQYMDESFLISKHRDSGKSLASKYALFNANTKTVDFSNYGDEEYIIGKFFLETHLNWPKSINPKKIDEKSKGDPTLLLSDDTIGHIPVKVLKLMNQYEAPNDLGKAVFTKLSDFFTKSSLERNLVVGTLLGLLVVLALTGTILGFVGTAGIGPFVLGSAAVALGSVGTGISLGAIGLSIISFFSAIFVLAGEYLRSNSKAAIHPKQVKHPYAPLLNTELNFIDETTSLLDIDTSYSSEIIAIPDDEARFKVKEVIEKPAPIRMFSQKEPEEMSELERISKNTLSLLVGAEIFGASKAKVYICKIACLGKTNAENKEILIEEHLQTIEAVTQRMPVKYHAKALFREYMEAIRAEIKPVSGLALQ